MPQASAELQAIWHNDEAGYDDGAWQYLKGLGWEESAGCLIPPADGPWADEKEKSAVEYLIDEWDYGFCGRERWRCAGVLKTANHRVFGTMHAATLTNLGTAILNYYVGAPSVHSLELARSEVEGFYMQSRFYQGLTFLAEDREKGRRA